MISDILRFYDGFWGKPVTCPALCQVPKYDLNFSGFKTDGFSQPRSLDNDLGAIIKAAEEFEWQRISFVLEVALSFGSSKCNVKNSLEQEYFISIHLTKKNVEVECLTMFDIQVLILKPNNELLRT